MLKVLGAKGCSEQTVSQEMLRCVHSLPVMGQDHTACLRTHCCVIRQGQVMRVTHGCITQVSAWKSEILLKACHTLFGGKTKTVYVPTAQSRGPQTFSVKGQVVSSSGFATCSVTTTHHYGEKVATVSERAWLCSCSLQLELNNAHILLLIF